MVQMKDAGHLLHQTAAVCLELTHKSKQNVDWLTAHIFDFSKVGALVTQGPTVVLRNEN